MKNLKRSFSVVCEPPASRINQANDMALEGRHAEAVEIYRELARSGSTFPYLWINLGISLTMLERLEEAAEAFHEAVRRQPSFAQAWGNLGSVLARLGRFDGAALALRQAVELAPSDLGARLNLARALQNAGDLEAIPVAEIAVQMVPQSAEAWCVLGDARLAFGDDDGSLTAYDRARGLDPSCLDGSNNLGLAYFRNGQLEESMSFFEEAVMRRAGDADAWCELGISRLHAGDVPGAIEALRASVERNPSNEYAHSNLVLSHCYSDGHTADDIRDEAIVWAKVHAQTGFELPPVHVASRDKLRVGYLSADFHAHPAGYLYEAMFPHHDRSRFEVFAYSNKDYADDVTRRIAGSADEWKVISDHSDQELAELVRQDGIDVFVDLLGHTPGHRLKAFGLRPAPVQATWLGYFGTTGMPQIDFILADRYVLPERHESHFVERAARMPGCLYVFQPPKLAIEPGSLPARSNGFVTFGCFNNLSKITPEVVALWCQVLRALPDSRMVLNRWPLKSMRVREWYASMFRANGVDPSRIEFRATSGREEYFRSYHDVDLMLDSFPFGGGTTTSEALWMGVPVVSLSAERFVGRMTESILHTVGVPELLPTDASDFVRKALELAGDLPQLEAYRSSLREKTVGSPLCDLPSYTRDLESTFEWMWENRRR
ncbi:tetratricopeptide repeat protein [bacterium]|nr:MAG: tetratricopeptide repeat protein [bacterium]